VLAWAAAARLAEGAPVPWGAGLLPLATDGVVSGFASIGNTLYLSGSFTAVGPNTGGGVPVDPVVGSPVPCYARVNGTVYACVADGSGGWFIGGDFSGVGGSARANVAHVREDGTVAPWRVDTDGVVRALALDGETLYLGGDFLHVANQERSHVAAASAGSGELTAWNPEVSGIAWGSTTVYCILPSTDVVYVGGDFTSVQGVARRCLAALDPHVPNVLEFDPEPDYTVYALARRDSSLYVGGVFYSMAGQPIQGLACVSATTGKLRPWGGGVSHPDYGYGDVDPYVSALAIADTSLYVAGHFTRVDGVVRGGLAAVDLATGRVQAWNPNPVDETRLSRAPYVNAVAVTDDVVYVGGRFGAIGSVARGGVATVSRTTGEVGGFDPRTNGEVFTVVSGDGSVFVGGAFSSLWDLQRRYQLAAIDLDTGTLKPWRAEPDWQIMCMAADEHAVYVGGRFTSINGVARQNIAALDPATGAVLDWNPGATGGFLNAVSTIAVGAGWIYIGGEFAAVGGLPRGYLAAIDTAGRVGPWDPEPNSLVTAIRPAGATVYVAGNFSQIGGQPRGMLAELDAASGTPTPWNPGTDGYVEAMAVAGNIVYVGGEFQELGGAARASLGAVDRATGVVTDWDPGAAASPNYGLPIIRALVPVVDVLYVAGHFAQIGGAPHSFAAALDTASATALDWDPDVSPGPLWGLMEREHTIYFGGRLNRYGVNPAGGYGVVPAVRRPRAAGNQVAVGSCCPNPATGSATLSFVLPAPAQVSLTVFDIQGRRVCQPIANETRSAGAQSVGIRVGEWSPGCYLCRLDIGGSAFTRKLVVLGG